MGDNTAINQHSHLLLFSSSIINTGLYVTKKTKIHTQIIAITLDITYPKLIVVRKLLNSRKDLKSIADRILKTFKKGYKKTFKIQMSANAIMNNTMAQTASFFSSNQSFISHISFLLSIIYGDCESRQPAISREIY